MKRKLMGILLVIFLLCGVGLYANYVIQNIDINVSEEDPDPTPLAPASPKTPLIVLKDNYTVFSYDALGISEGHNITDVVPAEGFKDTLKYKADNTNRILSLFCNNTFSTATDLFIFTSGATYTRSFVCVNRNSFTLAQDAITFVNQEVMNHIKVSDHDWKCDKAVKDFNFTNVYSYCSDRLKVSEVENNSFTLVGNNATRIDDTNPIYIIDLNNDKIGYQYACTYKSEIDTKEPIEVAVGQTWDATGEKGGFFEDKIKNGGGKDTKPVTKCIAPADYVSYTNTDQTKGTFTKAGKITMFTIRKDKKDNLSLVTYTINIKPAPTSLSLSKTLYSKNINNVNKDASQGASRALGLEVTMEGDEGYCEDVVWSSTDTDVLSFDEKGIPTAHKLGYTEITCTSAVNPKATKSCDYYVTLNPTSSTTYIGKESTMNSVSPDDGSASISAMDITSIDSEDKNIITARIDGKVIKFTGVSEGTTRLIVTTANATKYASVSCYKIEGPYAVGQKVILSVDDFANLSEKANKNIPTDRKISTEEKSYTAGVVTEDGRFKIDTSVAKENLGVRITLSNDPEKEELLCSYVFKVAYAPETLTLNYHLKNIIINTINRNLKKDLKPTLTFPEGTKEEEKCTDVIWSSSNTDVLSFDENGIPTAHKSGDVWIYCTSVLNPEANDKCHLYVNVGNNFPIGENTLEYIDSDDAIDLYMKWTGLTSENENIIKVLDNTKINCLKEGITKLSFIPDGSTETKYASCSVYKINGPLKVGQEVELSVAEFAKLSNVFNFNIPTDKAIKEVLSGGELTKEGKIKINTSEANDKMPVRFSLGDDDTEELDCVYIFKVYEPVASITLDPTEMSLVSNNEDKNSTSINVTVKGKDDKTTPTDKSVKWESSDKTIATVNDGKVTAVENAIGEAIITCSSVSDPDVKATCTVNVVKEVEEITVDPTEVGLIVDATKQLTATVLPTDAAVKDLEWYSGNTNVATVNKTTGLVTAVAKGTTNIYAKATDGSDVQSNWCEVTVKVPVTSIEIPKKLELKIDSKETDTLTATVLPTTATQTVKWYSDNTNIATVNEDTGVVTAVADGTTTVYAKATDGTDKISNKCEVKVRTCVKTITLDPDQYTLITNDNSKKTITIIATVEGPGGLTPTDERVTWKSEDENVATVDKKGTVTAVANGNTTITCTSVSDPDVSATCDIYVKTNVESITIPKTLELKIDSKNSDTLTATVLPETSSVQTVKWYSDKPSVATVNEDTGVVTAVANGTANITAKATDESGVVSKPCVVTVTTEVKSIAVTPTTLDLIIGKTETGTLTATVSPTTASVQKVKWYSNDTSVATVNEDTGVVTAVANGITYIYAKSTDGTEITSTSVCDVTVTTAVLGVELDIEEATVKPDETLQLTATITPETASNKKITWSTSDDTIVSVDQTGLVTAHNPGTATITVTTEDGGYTDTCEITTWIYVESVTLNKKKLYFDVGENERLYATINPADAMNKNVSWKSSDPSVAYVSQVGKVYAKGRGTATITVITEEGNKTDYCKVYVSQPVKSVKLSSNKLNMVVGEREQIYATVLPEDANVKTVYWSSNNTKVATVDGKGRIKAKSKGRATITVTTKDGNKKDHCIVYVK